MDCSIKYPLDILEYVPIKVGDFYVPIDYMILDMIKDASIQIILGRTFLATMRCKIDVKEFRLTCDMEENHAEFELFKGFEFSPLTLLASLLFKSPNDPPIVVCDLFKGQRLNSVKVEPFAT